MNPRRLRLVAGDVAARLNDINAVVCSHFMDPCLRCGVETDATGRWVAVARVVPLPPSVFALRTLAHWRHGWVGDAVYTSVYLVIAALGWFATDVSDFTLIAAWSAGPVLVWGVYGVGVVVLRHRAGLPPFGATAARWWAMVRSLVRAVAVLLGV